MMIFVVYLKLVCRNMGIPELFTDKKEQLFAIASKYGASRLRVFGSFARGDAGPTSDVDFLVDMEIGKSLFELGGLSIELEQLFGRKVDVVTEAGLRSRIREQILKEAVEI